jgi:hypothetical protein
VPGARIGECLDPALAADEKAMYTVARQHIIGSKIGAQQLDKLRPSHIEAWKVELEHRGSPSPPSALHTQSSAPCSTPPSEIEH